MPEREVDPAGEAHEPVVQLDADAGLGHRAPPRLERGEALLEGADQIDGRAAQLGPGRLGRAGQPAGQAVVAGDEDGEGLVDEMGRVGIAPPVDRELDGLVDHAAASGVGRPLEVAVRLEVVALAGVDAGEGVLGDVERLPAQLVHEVGQAGLELGDDAPGEALGRRRRIARAPQQFEDPALRGVERCRHGADPTKGVSQGSGMVGSGRAASRRTLWHPFAMIVGHGTSHHRSASPPPLAPSPTPPGPTASPSPGFRSPPRLNGVDRTLRRRGASASIAVRVRGRPWADVLADMVEGIVVANGLSGEAADAARAALAGAAGDELAARRSPPSSRVA